MRKLLQKEQYIPLFAGITMFSWGCAFPLIKLGMKAFEIDNQDTAAKTLFAGVRFLLAGLVVLLIAGRTAKRERVKDWGLLFVFSLVNTTLHYFFFYIGLSNTTGAKAAILDSLGIFLLMILAVLIFREAFSMKKLFGCLLGLTGILVLNLGGDLGGFHLLGDGMMLINSVCAAIGGILTRFITQRMDVVIATGISLFLGGLLLVIAGFGMGGRLTVLSLQGAWIMAGLVAISSISFILYNQLLAFHPVSRIAIYNALIPVVGALLSCLLLHEPFDIKYIPAGLLVMIGVYTVNRE